MQYRKSAQFVGAETSRKELDYEVRRQNCACDGRLSRGESAKTMVREGATLIAVDIIPGEPADAVAGVTYRRLDVSSPQQWSDYARWIEAESPALVGIPGASGPLAAPPLAHAQPFFAIEPVETVELLQVHRNTLALQEKV